MATALRWLIQKHDMTRYPLRLGLALAFFGAIEDHEYQILWQALWRSFSSPPTRGTPPRPFWNVELVNYDQSGIWRLPGVQLEIFYSSLCCENFQQIEQWHGLTNQCDILIVRPVA